MSLRFCYGCGKVIYPFDAVEIKDGFYYHYGCAPKITTEKS